jgi:membrane protein implicated in regulation of membrane protease activity
LLSSKVILKYALIHSAELALVIGALIVVRPFVGIPTWLTIAAPVVWILKDIALFPKVWRAYASDDNDPMRQFIGLEATVMDRLDPVGYVRVRGELWKAEMRDHRDSAIRGDRTEVVDTKGMTLTVELIGPGDTSRTDA